MPPDLCALLQRYNALARLLPALDDLEEKAVEARLVLLELSSVQATIDSFLAKARRQ